ncbi:Hsp20/alpha crystallin family protein [Paenibacillus chungangensis]|uniref:Hsp20/alpha crystallin family protein n=1 Tax=Paenibacillus chungangensis TaxID=696535 RepID=A0ABW3HMF7_9BACL
MTSKWDELERWMEGQQLPKGFEIFREPDWVENFVRKMMTKALPEAAGLLGGSSSTSAEFSESKQYLQVKYRLPSGFDRNAISLHVREDRVRVEGLPGGKRELIRLPKLVKPRICRAVVREGVLLVKLRKRQRLQRYHEHGILWE